MSHPQFINRLVAPIVFSAVFCPYIGNGRASVAATFTYKIDPGSIPAGEEIQPKSLLTTINERLGDAGRAKLLDNGHVQVEVDGDYDQAELESIKLRISAVGAFEFRITADPERPEDQAIVEQARLLSPEKKEVVIDDDNAAQWVTVSEMFGPIDAQVKRFVTREIGEEHELLVLVDPHDVSGKYFTEASKGAEQDGRPTLELAFNDKGASLLRSLTSKNLPDRAAGTRRNLAFILDRHLLSAPSIQTTISDSAVISGGMVEHEVDALVAVIDAGVLPYRLREVSGDSAVK